MRWSRIIGLTVLALVLIPSFGIALAEPVLTVSLDEGSYEPGDWVEIEGYTNVTDTVYLEVTNSTGDVIFEDDTEPVDEEFSFKFLLDIPGTYYANVTVDDLTEILTIEVVEESEEDEGDGATCEEMTEEELYAAIDRALRFIDRVNATANSIEDEYNMTDFYELVDELHSSLTELYDSIGTIPIEEARARFCELRKDVSSLNGLLNSVTKNVKVKKAERFMNQMEKLINSTVEKIERFNETEDGTKWRAALEAHKRKLERLRLTLNITNADELITEAGGVIEELNGDLDEFDSGDFCLKEMFKVQAKIQVLNATVERMKAKGKSNDMGRLQEKLRNAEALMGTLDGIEWEKNWGKMKSEVDEELSGVGKAIRELNKREKPDKSNKGGNGKGNGH